MQSDAKQVITKVFAHEEGAGTTTPAPEHGVAFHVNFLEAGTYRVFAQFRPKGSTLPPDVAILASFWVKVEEKAPFGVPPKVGLVLVSLVSIILLSVATKKFITVKRVPPPKKEIA